MSSKNINKIKVPQSPVVLAILDGWGHREETLDNAIKKANTCLLYTSPSPRDVEESRMPSSA